MKNKATIQLLIKDEKLKQVIETVSLPDFVSTRNVFHDLISCVLEQQIHYRSTKKIFQKMLMAADIEILSLDNFPQFEKRALATKKLSANKYETLAQIIDLFEHKDIDWLKLEDEEVRNILVKIKGISNWTVDMLLLYTLERDNIFPIDDYHLKQIMTKLYTIEPTSKLKVEMSAIAENWSPHRSWAVRYLLAWKEFYKKK